MKTKTCLLLCFLSYWSFSQQTLSGTVLGEQKTPLAFVTILVNQNPTWGVLTDIDGKFSIPHKGNIQSLQFSYIGYESLSLQLTAADFATPLSIQLQLSNHTLITAEVIAGENPAHRIIRKVVKNRVLHHPDKMESYQCESYNKMIGSFVIDRTKLEQHKKDKGKLSKRDSAMIHSISDADDQYFMILESVTDKKYARPNKVQETVLHNKVSGFKTPEVALLANIYQPFSFYEDYISLLSVDYLNPISPGSTKKYFFEIKDTLYQAQDSIFIIAFQARKGKIFNALKGLLYIHTKGYAIQNVIASPHDDLAVQIKIEQSYRRIDDQQWFPHQLNFEIILNQFVSDFLATKMKGTSHIRKVKLNPSFPKNLFRKDEVLFSDSVHYTTNSHLEQYRVDSLSQKEHQTYHFMDSLSQKIALEPMMDLMSSFLSGQYKISVIDLDMNRILAFNNYENVRLGLGMHSNKGLSKYFSIGGYFAYGFRDKSWKYGGDLRLWFPYINIPRLQLQASYSYDIREPAGLELPELVPLLFDRSLYLSRVDQLTEKSLSISGDLFKNFYTKIGLAQQLSIPLYAYQFEKLNDANQQNIFNFTEFQWAFRFAYGERFMQSKNSRLSMGTRFPILQFAYVQGLEAVLKGDYAYHRLSMALQDEFRIRSFGKIKYRLELGLVNGRAPYQKLFNGSGVGGNFAFLSLEQNFQTMSNYEFLSDRFAQLYFKYEIGNVLYKIKYSQPQLSLIQNTAIGDLKNSQSHQGIDFKTLELGYFEAGMVLENLIRIELLSWGYLGFGGGLYYRYGANSFADQSKNLALRATSNFSF